jgi:carbamate kinase
VRLVVGLGGNALGRSGEPPGEATWRARLAQASEVLARIAGRHQLVVTHGNGPQVGWLALQAAAAGAGGADRLDLLDAESEGMIGYWIEQELGNRLPGRELATLLTQVEVDPADPAFARPTKPIGAVCGEAQARALSAAHGWTFAPTHGGWRRVVASPEPRAVRELRAIELLVAAGVVVVCAGGGGIPVARGAAGAWRGVEAVVDKDLSTALLASALRADVLLLLTAVDAVYADWPEPARRPIARADPARLRALRLEPGSMGPKVEAACRFVEAGGERAVIGALGDAERLLAGEAGTQVSTA